MLGFVIPRLKPSKVPLVPDRQFYQLSYGYGPKYYFRVLSVRDWLCVI